MTDNYHYSGLLADLIPSQLLEGIRVISSSGGKTAMYQELVTAPLSREHNEDNITQDDDEDLENLVDDMNGVPSAIQKVSYYFFSYISLLFTNNQLRKIALAVCSSPQHCQAWLNEVTISLQQTENSVALMLILDVKTRWSLTHQMLHEYWLICLISLMETVSFRSCP